LLLLKGFFNLAPLKMRLAMTSKPVRVTTSRTGPKAAAILDAATALGVRTPRAGIAKAALCVERDGVVEDLGEFKSIKDKMPVLATDEYFVM
jgi:hypothetical protein